jgi:hypothetical protein
LQKIFQTTNVSWKDWTILFVFMALIFVMEEARKKYLAVGTWLKNK